MKQLSVEECLTHILKDIDKRRAVDYADRNSVRRYNAAMDRIVKRANYFCDNYPDKMELFTSFLEHPDYDIAATFTSTLFGLHNATKDHKLAAIASAKQLMGREGVVTTGPTQDSEMRKYIWSVNIERWEAKMQKDESSESEGP